MLRKSLWWIELKNLYKYQKKYIPPEKRQQYNFEMLLYFIKFFSHHKWNEVWLLVINMVYTSCLMILETWILENYEMPEKSPNSIEL